MSTTEQILSLVERGMGLFGKGLPDESILKIWIDSLGPFPVHVISRAFDQFCDESDFPPVPAAIVKRCKLLDGRPTADEAWAIALTSSDESETVVWTDEIAGALKACKPILDAKDKVGARVAFRDTYNRLVSDARAAFKSANWTVSLGTDQVKRSLALNNAVQTGLIAYESASVLRLPNEALSDEECASGKSRIRKLLDDLLSSQSQKLKDVEKKRLEAWKRQRDMVDAQKRRAMEQANNFRMTK